MKKKIFFALLVILLSILAATAWLYQSLLEFEQTPLTLNNKAATYLVKKGANLRKIANDLERKGIISDARYFTLLSRWKRPLANIKAGEYQLSETTTPLDFIDILVKGKSIEYKITLIEGWNFKQMMAVIHNNPVLIHQLSDKSDAAIMQTIGHQQQHPEGQFLPDTYLFTRGTTDVQLLKRIYLAMQSTLTTLWKEKADDLPLKSPYDALILASIIEKETAIGSEREKIAGVFIRRLNKNMKLQTDPTVIYGMGDAYHGNIRRKDLRQDTPYNTYVHKGLPPTPISMPGFAAIKAALHPASGSSLFFVANGQGGHTFSTTLRQHNNAVKRYLRGLKKK